MFFLCGGNTKICHFYDIYVEEKTDRLRVLYICRFLSHVDDSLLLCSS